MKRAPRPEVTSRVWHGPALSLYSKEGKLYQRFEVGAFVFIRTDYGTSTAPDIRIEVYQTIQKGPDRGLEMFQGYASGSIARRLEICFLADGRSRFIDGDRTGERAYRRGLIKHAEVRF